MINFNENLLTAMDLETTGLDPLHHDIVQICLLPLCPYTLEPHPKYRPFYQNVRPRRPENADPQAMAINGLDMEDLMVCPTAEQVEDAIVEWRATIDLPVGKRLIPLAQNSSFDVSFMQQFLGGDLYGQIFSRRGRDTMYFSAALADRASYLGFALPFSDFGLKGLCKHFGINIDGHHDAMADCIATAQVYRELLRMELME